MRKQSISGAISMNSKLLAFIGISVFAFLGCPVTEQGLSNSSSQTESRNEKRLQYTDRNYESTVKTVQFYRAGNTLSYPILYLGEEQQLRLDFDILQTPEMDAENLWIDVIACNHDWSPSNLLPLEFIDGFASDRIYNFERSQNTLVPYFHYQYDFPAMGSHFKRSGNYLLRVYRAGNEEDLLLSRRLIVAENKIAIEPQMGMANLVSERQKMQRIDFKLNIAASNFPGIFDPRNDLKVCLLQNFRWDNAKTDLQPMFSTDSQLDYSFDAANNFPGGNEYRHVDTRSIRFRSQNVKEIATEDSIVRFELYSDAPRQRNIYFTQYDLNGNFAVEVQEYPRANIEADYVFVRFSFKYFPQLENRDLYLIGKFNDWNLEPENKFDYNIASRRYEGEILLKQGIYDYAYATYDPKSKQLDEAMMEGSHSETENYYTILVYYHPIGARASELIGMKHINFYDR